MKTRITVAMLLGSFIVFLLAFSLVRLFVLAEEVYKSAIGDPGMRRDGLRVAIEAWNQCNEVGEEAPGMGSPRAADCFDIDNSTSPIKLVHKVNEEDNALGISNASCRVDVNQFAAWKEIYLGSKCQVEDKPEAWQFWMIMLKSGNLDTLAAICPKNGKKAEPFSQPQPRFPCFGKGCMNMPLVYHNYTRLEGDHEFITLRGSFYGTWDLDADVTKAATKSDDTSYYSVTWEKEVGKGSWVFHHLLKTSSKYSWLMLYFKSDSTLGISGGYHYPTRGMSKIVPKSPNFKVRFRLDIKQGGGSKSQFYLMDIGSCWKNNGRPCNGDVTTDVTRYCEMIINPSVASWCKPKSLGSCPPYHALPNGTQIHRTDRENYPYNAYHFYCSPGNAQHLEKPYKFCDPYSNPQPQEMLQILPHPAWGEYGFPTKKGEGWIGDPRTWELDVGRLSQSLYFYQDPGTKPAERYWPSINMGTEIYKSDNEIAEWTVRDFDIIISSKAKGLVPCHCLLFHSYLFLLSFI